MARKRKFSVAGLPLPFNVEDLSYVVARGDRFKTWNLETETTDSFQFGDNSIKFSDKNGDLVAEYVFNGAVTIDGVETTPVIAPEPEDVEEGEAEAEAAPEAEEPEDVEAEAAKEPPKQQRRRRNRS